MYTGLNVYRPKCMGTPQKWPWFYSVTFRAIWLHWTSLDLSDAIHLQPGSLPPTSDSRAPARTPAWQSPGRLPAKSRLCSPLLTHPPFHSPSFPWLFPCLLFVSFMFLLHFTLFHYFLCFPPVFWTCHMCFGPFLVCYLFPLTSFHVPLCLWTVPTLSMCFQSLYVPLGTFLYSSTWFYVLVTCPISLVVSCPSFEDL